MKRWLAAFRNSFAGLRHGFKREAPVREEILAFLFSLPVAPFVANSVWHLLLLWGVLLFILIVELLNTGIEALADEVSLEKRDNIRIAKDCGSAAVLLATFIAVAVWGVSLWQLVF